MTRWTVTVFTVAALLMPVAGTAQNRPDLPQIVAQLRQSIAQNQAELRQYSWTETTEISIKSETKKRGQKDCHYAADGTLQKTPVGSPPEPRNAPRGVKGKIVANKVEDMQQYLDRVGSLVRRYVPPDPQAMKTAFDAGKASVGKGSEGAFASVVFRDYAKPGDEVTLLLDPKTKKLRTFRVATYLDAPGRVTASVISVWPSHSETWRRRQVRWSCANRLLTGAAVVARAGSSTVARNHFGAAPIVARSLALTSKA